MKNEKFDKSKNNRLLLMFILYVIIQGASVVFYSIEDYFDLPWTAECVLMASICFVLYRSYRSHTKNVMKPLLGAALALLLYYELDWGMYYLQNLGSILAKSSNELPVIVYVIAQILIFVVVTVINILHYSINYTHHSSPGLVKTNKIMYILFIVFLAVQCVSLLFIGRSALITVSNLCGTVADIFVLGAIISIESNLEKFRVAREAKAEEATEA